MSGETAHDLESPARCKNCGVNLLGRYCVNCSQAANVHVPTTMELVHELLEGLTHSDSRLWRTLKYLWFKPGRLTQEFVAGKRIAYLPPFRLYLILSLLFFLIFSFSHSDVQIIKFDTQRTSASSITSCADFNVFENHPEWNERVRQTCLKAVRDNGESLRHAVISTLPKAMFIFLPLVALLNMLLYWHPRYRYAEHLLFFVHLHAFFFSALILSVSVSNAAQLWPGLKGASDVLNSLMDWTMAIYAFIAIRRVFAKSWTGAFFKSVALFFVYMIMFGLTLGAVVVYNAWRL
jgi:Protein of unknown function (DUF3667)